MVYIRKVKFGQKVKGGVRIIFKSHNVVVLC